MSNARLVVMVGGPGSGKSYVRSQLFADLPVVDCDSVKASHPDYDPKNPAALHAWSAAEAMRALLGYLSRGESVVYDGTGTNLERLATLVSVAHAAGMSVQAVLVTCSLATALQRNAARERTVPEHVVRMKHAQVGESWLVLRSMVDCWEVYDNERNVVLHEVSK